MVIDENDELAVKEYVIKDNLLRRHLKPEQRAVLEYELYKVHEKKPGARTDLTSGHNAPKSQDVYENLAKDSGTDRKTVVRHIQYAKAVEAEPERFKGKKVTHLSAKFVKALALGERSLGKFCFGHVRGSCQLPFGVVDNKTQGHININYKGF